MRLPSGRRFEVNGMLKLVIFDAYGTLFDTGTGSVDAAADILRKRNRTDIDPAAFYRRWKRLHREHIQAQTEFICEFTVFAQDLRRLYEEYRIDGDPDEDVLLMLARQGTRTAYPESRTALERIGRSAQLCIGSTTDTAPLMQDLARAGLPVRHVFTSEGLRTYKPRPEFYKTILREMNVSAAEALFVGDSLHDDVEGPQRAGIRACWLNRKNADPGHTVPDFTAADLTEVADIVSGLILLP